MNTVASLADILLQRKIYEDKEELVMVNHVYPEFVSQHRYLRACACREGKIKERKQSEKVNSSCTP